MIAARRLTGRIVALVVVAALVAVIVVWRVGGSSGYTVTLQFPAATDLGTGGLVDINGFKVGNVKKLSVKSGQALVQVTVNAANAPLHTGTTADIQYRSLLGERYVELTPGPQTNPVLPNGAMVSNGNGNIVPRVEISDLLNRLDPTTRSQLADLMPQVQQILAGPNTGNAQQTLQTAEPAVRALAQVLDAVGADGQTLHQLVTDMAGLSTRLVTKQSSLVSTVSGLDQAMGALATQTSGLSTGISALPSTLTQAQSTLDKVPATASVAVPLLGDLRSATSDLPAFASKLSPVLTELQPVSAQLVGTVNGLDNLLHYTPALVGSANATVPAVTAAAKGLQPALQFLRPYSPEMAGILTNWGSWLDTYNATGHLVPIPAIFGATSLDIPGLPNTAGLTTDANRPPGGLIGQPQPVTDAAGNPAQ